MWLHKVIVTSHAAELLKQNPGRSSQRPRMEDEMQALEFGVLRHASVTALSPASDDWPGEGVAMW